MKIDFEKAVALLKENDNILILTHINPDGDTIGSGFALLRALRKMGKKARVLNGDTIPKKYGYICDGVEDDDFKEEFIVSVDVAEKKLLGEKLKNLYGDKVDLSLDHHLSTRLFAKETYCEDDSASACEVLYLVIKALGVELDKDIANALYTGITTDTGCFKYSNVTKRTHLIAAELISLGAEYSKINEIMFDRKTKGFLLLQKMCLESLKFYAEGKIAAITVTQKMLIESGTEKSDLDAIKPLTRQIEGVSVGITVKEEEGRIGVSVRTDENADASAICAHFGGGGHKRASGCEIKNEPIEKVSDIVADYVIKNIL